MQCSPLLAPLFPIHVGKDLRSMPLGPSDDAMAVAQEDPREMKGGDGAGVEQQEDGEPLEPEEATYFAEEQEVRRGRNGLIDGWMGRSSD